MRDIRDLFIFPMTCILSQHSYDAMNQIIFFWQIRKKILVRIYTVSHPNLHCRHCHYTFVARLHYCWVRYFPIILTHYNMLSTSMENIIYHRFSLVSRDVPMNSCQNNSFICYLILAVNGSIITSPENLRPSLTRPSSDGISDVKKSSHVCFNGFCFSSKQFTELRLFIVAK